MKISSARLFSVEKALAKEKVIRNVKMEKQRKTENTK